MEHLTIEGGHEYLPFARSRIKALRATGQRYASQQFNIGGAMVRVRIVDVHEYISISGGRAGYEFWCADQWFVDLPFAGAPGRGTRDARTAADGSFTGSAELPYVKGSAVNLAGGSQATAVFAMTLQPLPDSTRQWPVKTLDSLSRGGKSQPDTANAIASWKKAKPDDFFTMESWTLQAFQERHTWYNNEPQKMVHSVCATGLGSAWNSNNQKWYAYSPQFYYTNSAAGFTSALWNLRPGFRGQDPRHYLADENLPQAGLDNLSQAVLRPAKAYEAPGAFDIRPVAYFAREGLMQGAHTRTQQANWRHAAIVKATAQDGSTHNYFVSTDTHGVFTFYRAKDYLLEWIQAGRPADWRSFRLPNAIVKVVRPDYPAWVTVTPDAVSATADHWQWQFNKDATKAATTPLKIEDSYVNTVVRYGLAGTGSINYELLGATANQMQGSFGRALFDQGMRLPGAIPAQVRRVQVWRKTSGPAIDLAALYEAWFRSLGAFTAAQMQQYLDVIDPSIAFDIDGKLYPALFEAGVYAGAYTMAFSLPAAVSLPRGFYEPVKATTPGFVEVAIQITVNDNNPDDFTPTVTVVDAENYGQNKRFFMDAGYYIPTPRISAEKEEIAEDELLTAEIEIFHKPVEGKEFVGGTKEFFGSTAAALGSAGRDEEVIALHSPVFARSKRLDDGTNPLLAFPYPGSPYTQAQRDASSLEQWVLGDHCGTHLYVYYTVRERRTKKVVKRLCLAHDAQWQQGEFGWLDNQGRKWWTTAISPGGTTASNADYSLPAGFFGTLEQADLRFLNFLTTTRARNAFVDDGDRGGGDATKWRVRAASRPFNHLPQNMLPRFDLRVHGEKVRTVDYSRPEVSGFNTAYGSDPMTELATPPEGAVRLPGKPDDNGFTFCFLQWCAHQFVNILHNDAFSFSPDGSYAVYADRRSVGLPLGGTTTEAELATGGVFDVIHDHPAKKTTTHKKAFNDAFGQSRDYSYWDKTQGDQGGFATTGIWLGKPTSKSS